jgi:class 3 adenylate cyclase
VGEDVHVFEIDDNAQTMNKKQSHHTQKNEHRQNINQKIKLLNEMNKTENSNDTYMVIDTSAMEFNSTHGALYAETLSNVCKIFADIKGFSQILLELRPIKAMDMLQELFSRFDALCAQHGKNMIRRARWVLISTKNQIQSLEIHVGIHIGEITAGLLGERLPKFTVFGTAVNLSARMKQECSPGMIRVAKDFFDLLQESDDRHKKEVLSIKNMGEVETYLIDPLKD